ncbi:MAG TPA: diaminopimelate epimerase [Syntrophales bacterium]|nr:diaminopimelate epimerase [Syntrophales bacterium]HOM06198.1 diaminopimelate epimerase [Syntrophales bacterium]HPC00188.1 diaminopimelate epimerase [Syntrophales bacterium]HPQ05820.1 diaminopimelate epimerase [Syntrophales bacterium]HRV41863.1 diaminopimelate epimerase [Syntrophales bacterium]
MIPFAKMNGSGNDFILIDNRARPVEAAIGALDVKDFVRAVCTPKLSVGADGLILIQESARADFSWRFFNADGSEVEMCGNGGRCAARFALLKGIAPTRMTFETAAGLIDAEVTGPVVKLRLTDPFGLSLDEVLPVEGEDLVVHSVNTGVPHAVVFAKDLEGCDVFRLGRALRYHERFRPAGTNANFIRVVDDGTIAVRTYERGVEDETLACGTGSVASALVAAAKGLVRSPVAVRVKSGETLRIHFAAGAGGFEKVYLEGKTALVCEGCLKEEGWLFGRP